MAFPLQADVLVLGGGGAGLCSALAAVEGGASVTLVYKHGGNSTAVAAGGFAVVTEGSESDSAECFISDALRSGAQLASPALLRTLADNASRAIETITGWGVEFYRNPDGSYRRFRSGGHTNPRSLRCATGRGSDAYRVMLDRARAKGVRIVRNTVITELLKDGDRIVGAACLGEDGAPLVILAKSVILATGGMGALYEHTTNTPGLTGEGYFMAHEAGCRLRDMEFVQFMPTTIAYPPQFSGKLVNDTLRGEGAYLLNAAGERFMAGYAPQFMEVAGRDILSIAIATEILAGRGSPHGGVYLDARHIPQAAMLQSFGAAKAMRVAGIDPCRDLIEVVPAAHFSCGGVVIDAECRTGVDGLFAVGEVTGGIHGANRLGATALTENVVFGQIAGSNAAKDAAGQRAMPSLPE
ncbi:MAG: FAD-binding protein, partial [Pseudoflavonifractor sp.]